MWFWLKFKMSPELCRFEWSIGAKVKRHHIEQTLAMWHNSHLAKQVPGRAVVLQWGDFFLLRILDSAFPLYFYEILIINWWRTLFIIVTWKGQICARNCHFFSFKNIKQPIRLICHRFEPLVPTCLKVSWETKCSSKNHFTQM